MDDRRGRWAALQKQFGTQQGGPTAAKVIEDMIALLRTSLAEDDGICRYGVVVVSNPHRE